MKKSGMIFCSVLLFTILIGPLTNPTVQAITVSGLIPIPGNLIPIPSNGVPIVPNPPNLGTVPVAPPVSIYSIDQVKSGLVKSDPLNNEIKTQQQLQADPGYWTYGGDAPLLNANYDFFKDGQGLHIGSQAPANGTWAGFYAASPNTNAMLFHSVITTPVRAIPYQFYENGMYVQTSQPFINYVTCVTDTSAFGTVWAVVSTTGDANQATQFNVLWVDTSANQPLTRDCTIVTNGDNLMKVYLDGVLVYENSNLKLQMPAPFNTYLEPQSSYPGQLLNGVYKDYYATTGESVKIINNPALAATVKLVDPTGKVLASSPVNSGTATLTIGQFHMPLAAYIKVYDSFNIQLASTSSPVNIFGGDEYTVKSAISTWSGLNLPIVP